MFHHINALSNLLNTVNIWWSYCELKNVSGNLQPYKFIWYCSLVQLRNCKNLYSLNPMFNNEYWITNIFLPASLQYISPKRFIKYSPFEHFSMTIHVKGLRVNNAVENVSACCNLIYLFVKRMFRCLTCVKNCSRVARLTDSGYEWGCFEARFKLKFIKKVISHSESSSYYITVTRH